MAVVMMGEDEEKPILHDFLGGGRAESFPPSVWAKSGENRASDAEVASASASAGVSSGGQGLVSGSSDLGSGRKRSNSDSAYMGLIRERMRPVVSDSLESSHLMKMFRKEVVSERLGRSHDDDMLLTMQPPPRPNSSLILQPSLSNRPDSLVSKLDQSMPINPGPMVHYPSRFGQSGTHVDKLSSYTNRDANVGVTLISQTAADEGSRTGIKRTGIMNVTDPTSVVGERNSIRVLSSSDRPKASQIIEQEPSNVPSRHSITSSSRQMTIFYAGQAHVFDDVHPNKADVIMALAGSNGGSWLTTYSPKSSVCLPTSEAKLPDAENKMHVNNLACSQVLNHRLSIQENSGHGLSPLLQMPVTGDPPNLTSGRAARDSRLTVPAAKPNTDGRDV